MGAPTSNPVLRWITVGTAPDRTIPLRCSGRPADLALPGAMKPMSSPTALLQQRYRDSLPTKHAELSSRWELLQADPTDRDVQRALQQALHRLAGSAGAYDYAVLGDLARNADAIMIRNIEWLAAKPETPMPLEDLAAPLGQLLQRLQDEF